MKLATYKDGSRDGQLVVVSRDLATAHYATGIAGRLQQVLDDWSFLSPAVAGPVRDAEPGQGAPRLPVRSRAVHGAAAARLPVGRRLGLHQPRGAGARGAQQPRCRESFYTDPLMYQGGSDDFLGPLRRRASCPARTSASTSRPRSRWSPATCRWAPRPSRRWTASACVMLANDVSLRNLIPDELAKGFGFFQSKPATAFSPVAVTPDELGDAWAGRPRAPDAAKQLERPQGRHVRRRRRR